MSTGLTDTKRKVFSSLRYFSFATNFSLAGGLRTVTFLVAFLT